ncbi:cbb3-type cytochrome oxidase assembly protein CcoS [Maribacter sp. Asnod2-G09]|jgi:cbb3-type cytochrome oxidase maturation protein|uniref:cbb3-type cytochrome oxidase assembly protein CcoS n=1 Tax=Maribacter sp. Asnod2-G09 TaxID=3160577 RepID=UPI002619697C|nr:cbb3-type cytochrome oxidase assembly protein CcoS [uncultured Maribacter sp.]
MSVIYVLLGISLVVAIIFFVAFIVSVRQGQYDDSYTPSVRMLFDDELVKPKKTSTKEFKQEKIQLNKQV